MTTGRKKMAPAAGKRGSVRQVKVVVIDPSGAMSPYARKALKVFRDGVQLEYKRLAKKGVATVATVDGRVVRAVPKKVNNRFVLVAPGKNISSKAGASFSAKAASRKRG
jgi:hypothetical protein